MRESQGGFSDSYRTNSQSKFHLYDLSRAGSMGTRHLKGMPAVILSKASAFSDLYVVANQSM